MKLFQDTEGSRYCMTSLGATPLGHNLATTPNRTEAVALLSGPRVDNARAAMLKAGRGCTQPTALAPQAY